MSRALPAVRCRVVMAPPRKPLAAALIAGRSVVRAVPGLGGFGTAAVVIVMLLYLSVKATAPAWPREGGPEAATDGLGGASHYGVVAVRLVAGAPPCPFPLSQIAYSPVPSPVLAVEWTLRAPRQPIRPPTVTGRQKLQGGTH